MAAIPLPDWLTLAIITDPEDVWGTYQHMGLAELAARLGSQVSYDRRGNVVWLTNFDHGLQGVEIGVDNAASTYELTMETAVSGPFSLKFDPRAAADSYVNWRRIFYPLMGDKIGGEFMYSFQPNPISVYFRVRYYDGDDVWEGRLTYTIVTEDWTRRNTAGGETLVLENTPMQSGLESWHSVKIVIDTVDKVWVRCLIDNNEVDVEDLALYTASSSGLGVAELKFQVDGSAAAHAPVYLDSIILTQNEPD